MNLFVSPAEYFSELVKEGLQKSKLQAPARAENYLTSLLQSYLLTENLFEREIDDQGNPRPQTLAEMYLITVYASSCLKNWATNLYI
jgi:hypothetical protein